MKTISLFFIFFVTFVQAQYMSNYSCSECHEKIYNEFENSMHSKNYFSDELHRHVADSVSTKKYDCAACHMPAADNLYDLMTGKARPDKHNVTHTDAISCYYCHKIAYVKKSHKHYINVIAKDAGADRPSFYGELKDPEDVEKHYSLHSPIYTQNVCKGCHSYKLNDFNTTIFHAMKPNQDSKECIKCHMPNLPGGNVEMNHKARMHHVSHKFLGIHDKEFRKKGLDINATINGNSLTIKLKNKMAHPLIIQPARAKYLQIRIVRDDKIVWQNYKKFPDEDRQGYFGYRFWKGGKRVIVPSRATKHSENNIDANATKTLIYHIPPPKEGDRAVIKYFVRYAKRDCIKAVNLSNKIWQEPELIKEMVVKAH